MQFNKYFFSAFTSFFIWGFFSLALKPLHDYPSLDILFYRVFYATVLLLVINLFFRKDKLKKDFKFFKTFTQKDKRKTVALTILGGFLLTFNWFLFMYAVNHVSLQSASFAYLICPIITTILAFFILNETLSKWQWFSVLLCIVSCGILSYGHVEDLIYSLVIATTFALYLISQRKNNQFDRFVVLTVQMVIASLVLLPFFPVYKGTTPTEGLFYILMILIVVLFTIIPLFLNLFALKGMNSSTVGILMYTNPLINFILAIFYFNEKINAAQMIANGLIMTSIIIFNEKIIFKRKSL
ncbi:EamA family transporter [Flavobacterium sp. GCM10027622]|uniref:EamA family transporter n=1 Tax=unclassified Flavobacterium TaxID=196869 RepID=UPI003613AF30